MAAGLLYFPGAMPSYGLDGERVSAELRFFLNETATPATVYTDAALSVAHTYPIASDAFGNFPAIWADTSNTFSASWVTADGQTDALDNLTPSTSANQALYDATLALKGDVEQLKEDTQQIKDDAEALYGDLTAVQQAVADAEQAVTDAQAQVTLATAQVGLATIQAGNAATSAGNASISAGTATTQAGIATTQAGNASTSAGAAATSATQARSYTSGALYTFSTTTTDSDPGAGNLRLNNASPVSATFIYADNLDQTSADISAWLDSFDDSSSAIKGQIYLREGATNKIAIFSVTGAVVNGTGYRKIPVAYIAGTGTAFTNAATLGINFSGNGDTAMSASVNYSAKTGAYTVISSDWGSIIDCTSGTFTLTFTSAAALGAGFYVYLRNSGTGVITGPTADGATVTLNTGDEVLIESDGSTFHMLTLKRGGWTLFQSSTVSTPVANVAVTSIPQNAASLMFGFVGVSHNDGSTRPLQAEISTNNGSSYSTAVNVSATIAAADALSGSIYFPHYRADAEVALSGLANASSPALSNLTLSTNFAAVHTGGMNAIRFAFTAGSIDAGTINTWIKS